MDAERVELIGRAHGSDHLWTTLETLVDGGSRMAGSGGERRGAAVLERRFAELDPDRVHTEEFPIPGWRRGGASIRVPSRGAGIDAEHEILPLPGTPEADVSADLVDLGHGRPDDFEDAPTDGAIVMVSSHTPPDADRPLHRLDKFVSALESGAAGFVYGNHSEGCLPLTGEVGWHSRPASIPAVGVSAEVRHRLARWCRDGPETVRMQVDCRTEPATSRNVQTVVGPDRGREVLVTAHVDSYELGEGARDNGVGCALVAEIGRLLSRFGGNLDTPVRLVVFGAEEIGMYGASHWVETHDTEAVKCVVNVDGAGDTRDLRLMANGFEGMVAPFEAATDRLGVPLRTEHVANTTTDGWPFAAAGVPAVTVASDRHGTGRGWGHTHADTLDKLDSRVLRDLAITLTMVVLECVDDGFRIRHRSPAAVLDGVPPETKHRMRVLCQLGSEEPSS